MPYWTCCYIVKRKDALSIHSSLKIISVKGFVLLSSLWHSVPGSMRPTRVIRLPPSLYWSLSGWCTVRFHWYKRSSTVSVNYPWSVWLSRQWFKIEGQWHVKKDGFIATKRINYLWHESTLRFEEGRSTVIKSSSTKARSWQESSLPDSLLADVEAHRRRRDRKFHRDGQDQCPRARSWHGASATNLMNQELS